MLSPNFQVAQFEIEEFNEHPINIQYKFNGSDKVSVKELFKVGSSFPSTKTITFENKLGGLDLLVNYADGAELLEGLPKQIAQYGISEGKIDEGKAIEKYSFIMRVANNIHNIATLEDAELAQEWTEEEKIPIKASPVSTPPPKKEGEEGKEEEKPAEPIKQPEQQYEIKKKNKKNFHRLKFSTSSFALAPAVRKQFLEAETKMTEADFSILDAKAKKNALETYCYDMRSKVEAYGNLEKYIDAGVRDSFVKEINEVVDWLYADGENVPAEEYNKKLAQFMAIGEPVK